MMAILRWILCALFLLGAGAVLHGQEMPDQEDLFQSMDVQRGCSYRSDPEGILSAQKAARTAVYESSRKWSSPRARSAVQAASSIPQRNFIDAEIFGRLMAANIALAPVSGDEEFVRRIYFDLAGRKPTVGEIREFLADGSREKRDQLIDRLLYSPEFAEKWSVWFSDLTGMTESLSTNNRRPQIEGRNSWNIFVRDSFRNSRNIRDLVKDTLTGTGNNYFTENGRTNFTVLGSAAMGPIQDTYDMMLVQSARSYLGMGHYDCLLCHNGRGHMEQLSSWATRTTRGDAWRMAAHFSRTRLNNGAPGARQYEHMLFNSTDVVDDTRGQYDLNVTFGNRPERCLNNQSLVNGRCPQTGSVTPEYRDRTPAPAAGNWRAAFADKLVADPMFARNFANRLWKEFFGLALVDPVDTLDPDRLDPAKPPAAPWTLQASHPVLLEKLAEAFSAGDTDLRTFIRQLVQSSAYQLSSDYGAEWKYEYTQLFARHYPRRLMAEEIHDAIVSATGVPQNYTWPLINGQTVAQGTALKQSDPVQSAMMLPDINEPRGNGAVRDFLASFGRGNRDTTQRNQSGSILQQLNMMNDALITNRIKASASPVIRELLKISDGGELADELFLQFLARRPTTTERQQAQAHLAKAGTAAARTAAVEDLAWAVINKIDFVFSY